MQWDRAEDQCPWTWEIPLAVVCAIVVLGSRSALEIVGYHGFVPAEDTAGVLHLRRLFPPLGITIEFPDGPWGRPLGVNCPDRDIGPLPQTNPPRGPGQCSTSGTRPSGRGMMCGHPWAHHGKPTSRSR